jgi:formamidopyrimidine-DNA glycosylase
MPGNNKLLKNKAMPELPEVHHFQQYFNRHALKRRISEVQVHDGKILRNISAEDFAQRLMGHCFTSSYRRGKYLFAQLDHGPWLQLHFGMTGDLRAYGDPADKPRFERFAWHFEDSSWLGYDCSRKFSRICWVENLEAWIAELGLGEDALSISERDFLALFRRHTGIKALLLNQKALAGVGNLYADEILFQTRVHPSSRASAIPPERQKAIYQAVRSILSAACERLAYYKDYPEDWFWQWRQAGAPGPEGQGTILRATIAGRTTYWWDGQVEYR